ncbi:MAG: glycoside hydrolase family 43 protein [Treponema sp.]|nr:glycoside hydrolase family 43 protein [Treponema sp.]
MKQNFLFCLIFIGVLSFLSCPGKDVPIDDSLEALKYFFETDGGFPDQLSNSWKIWNHRNPLFTQAFGADPNVLVYNDRVYVYMSNDTLVPGGANNTFVPSYGQGIQGIRIISSADLANWTDHGAVNITGPANTNPLVSNDEWNNSRLINNHSIDRSWAPVTVCKKIDGKDQFFLYWGNGGNGVGVVVADSPIGPFRAPSQNLMIDRNTPNCSTVDSLFDPGVIVDNDGQAYMYLGGGEPNSAASENARRVQLGADMISIIGTPETFIIPNLFEALDIKKIRGKYYVSYMVHYSGGNNLPGRSIAYMMSDTPMGEYSAPVTMMLYAAVASQLGSKDSNNHHAMFEFKGETYITYHTRKLGEAMGVVFAQGSSNPDRVAFIDKMPINPDGTIPRVTMTRKGVDQVGYLDPYVLNEAETIGIQGGIYTRPDANASNNMLVTSIDTGDWLAVYGVDFGTTGAAKFSARVRTPNSPNYIGAIQLRINPEGDGVTSNNGNLTPTLTARIKGGEVIGYMLIKAVPGKEGGYMDVTIDLEKTVTGVNNLVFVFYSSLGVKPETVNPDSRHKNGFEFDQWQFFLETNN